MFIQTYDIFEHNYLLATKQIRTDQSEEPLEIHAASIEEKLERSEGVLDEKVLNWADATEEEEKDRNGYEEQETFHVDLTGRVLKYEKVIAARLHETESLIKMEKWEVVPLRQCTSRTKRRPIKRRWVDIDMGDDDLEVYRSRYVAREIKSQNGGADAKIYV